MENMAQEKRAASVTMKDIWVRLLWRLPLWLFFAAAAGAAVLAYHYYLEDWNACSAIVSFSYDGIEVGRDPMGNRFDETEIKSEPVLLAAAERMGMTLTEENRKALADAISIRGNVPGDIFERILTYDSIFGEEEVETFSQVAETSFFPSQHSVTLHYVKAGLSAEEGMRFLTELLSAYEKYFYDKYGYNKVLNQSVLAVDYRDYDYIDAMDVLEGRLASIRSYLSTLANQDNTRYVSEKTGYSFPDLIDAVDTLRSENLDWAASYVVSNNITKDRDELIDYYHYRIEETQRELAQHGSRLALLNELIASYEKTNAVFLGVGATGQEDASASNFEFSQQSAMYDRLVNEKVSRQTAISETNERIALYNRRLERLSSTESTGNPALVEAELETLANKVNQLLSDTDQTADEYFKRVWLKRAFQVLEVRDDLSSNLLRLVRLSLKDGVLAEAVVFGLFMLFSCRAAVRKKQKMTNRKPQKQPQALKEPVQSAEQKRQEEPQPAMQA